MFTSTPIHPDAAASLMMAVIACADAPLVLLDGELRVITASKSFCRSFQIEPSGVEGRELLELGTGEWNVPQLGALLKATVSGFVEIKAYEMDLKRAGWETRRLVLNGEKLDYLDTEHVRLLLSVADVTEARIAEKQKDSLAHDKEVLHHELQHRVANSLQIIASVLMQSAMKVQSDEARGHLRDAHNRVLSIAAVQRQLVSSHLDVVQLRPYLTALCRSIGASMIPDPAQLSLDVTVDDSATDADASASLGLIVTELIINALKHAFPGGRGGKISVDYHSYGPNWKLSVGDNGVGMPADSANAKPGLGTSIIEALARQLHADIQVSSNHPGTEVTIMHKQIAAVPDTARAV